MSVWEVIAASRMSDADKRQLTETVADLACSRDGISAVSQNVSPRCVDR
jgi:hypothetical protein